MSKMPSSTKSSVENLENLSKKELIAKITKLEARVTNLQNMVQKRSTISPPAKKLCKDRPFDFSRFKRRHIALRFFYLGWNFQGFVTQIDTTDTVENYLMEALMKAKLIDSRETANYHRCGRTDKGVSSYGQVVSLDVRTNLDEGVGVFEPTDYRPKAGNRKSKEEINYCLVLNKLLPPEIRVTGWTPVEIGFSSRHNCRRRMYKYFFPVGSLNIDAMREAAAHFVGTHDFSNFCKNNPKIEVRTVRTIFSTSIEPVESVKEVYNADFQFYCFTVISQSFIWHQIRCMMAILCLVGEGKEKPELIAQLLDVEKVYQKPQYNIAWELPLVLFDCAYDEADISNWIVKKDDIRQIFRCLQKIWCRESTKSQIIRSMLDDLRSKNGVELKSQHSLIDCDVRESTHRPILERPRCSRSTKSSTSIIAEEPE